jgi:hypothetical protein
VNILLENMNQRFNYSRSIVALEEGSSTRIRRLAGGTAFDFAGAPSFGFGRAGILSWSSIPQFQIKNPALEKRQGRGTRKIQGGRTRRSHFKIANLILPRGRIRRTNHCEGASLMPVLRFCALVLLAAGFVAAANAQTDKPFPTDDEINLLLTQTERAIQQYKPLIDQEEIQMGKSYAEAAAKDRQVVNGLETAVRAFKSNPQAFNGSLGFIFFGWLDDADRNALLCASGALLQASQADTTGRASGLLQLAQNCQAASTLIYTVSENANSLYGKYVEAEAQLAGQAVDTMQKCKDILKRNSKK